MPQYQLAVDKSRYMGMIPLARAFKNAEEQYYMANGVYTSKIEDLDISIPGERNGNACIQVEDDMRLCVTAYYLYIINNTAMLKNSVVLGYDNVGNPWGWRCQAAVNNSRAQALCRSLGGKLAATNTPGCVIGTCDWYDLSF